jgi:hypothetical protein
MGELLHPPNLHSLAASTQMAFAAESMFKELKELFFKLENSKRKQVCVMYVRLSLSFLRPTI